MILSYIISLLKYPFQHNAGPVRSSLSFNRSFPTCCCLHSYSEIRWSSILNSLSMLLLQVPPRLLSVYSLLVTTLLGITVVAVPLIAPAPDIERRGKQYRKEKYHRENKTDHSCKYRNLSTTAYYRAGSQKHGQR